MRFVFVDFLAICRLYSFVTYSVQASEAMPLVRSSARYTFVVLFIVRSATCFSSSSFMQLQPQFSFNIRSADSPKMHRTFNMTHTHTYIYIYIHIYPRFICFHISADERANHTEKMRNNTSQSCSNIFRINAYVNLAIFRYI